MADSNNMKRLVNFAGFDWIYTYRVLLVAYDPTGIRIIDVSNEELNWQKVEQIAAASHISVASLTIIPPVKDAANQNKKLTLFGVPQPTPGISSTPCSIYVLETDINLKVYLAKQQSMTGPALDPNSSTSSNIVRKFEIKMPFPILAIRATSDIILVQLRDGSVRGLDACDNQYYREVFKLKTAIPVDPTAIGLSASALTTDWLAFAPAGPPETEDSTQIHDPRLGSVGAEPSVWVKDFRAKKRTIGRLAKDSTSQVYKSLSSLINSSTKGAANAAKNLASAAFIREGAAESRKAQGGLVTIVGCANARKGRIRDGSSTLRVHSSSVSLLREGVGGDLLVSASVQGHIISVMRVGYNESEDRWKAHILCRLRRGYTDARICDISISKSGSWVAVSSVHGTTHIYPVRNVIGTGSSGSYDGITDAETVSVVSTSGSSTCRSGSTSRVSKVPKSNEINIGMEREDFDFCEDLEVLGVQRTVPEISVLCRIKQETTPWAGSNHSGKSWFHNFPLSIPGNTWNKPNSGRRKDEPVRYRVPIVAACISEDRLSGECLEFQPDVRSEEDASDFSNDAEGDTSESIFGPVGDCDESEVVDVSPHGLSSAVEPNRFADQDKGEPSPLSGQLPEEAFSALLNSSLDTSNDADATADDCDEPFRDMGSADSDFLIVNLRGFLEKFRLFNGGTSPRIVALGRWELARSIMWKDRHQLKFDDFRTPDGAALPRASPTPIPVIRKSDNVSQGSESELSVSGQKFSMSPVSQEVMHSSLVSVPKRNPSLVVSEGEKGMPPCHTRDQLHRRTHASAKKSTSHGKDDTNASQIQREGAFGREDETIIRSFSHTGLSNDPIHSEVNVADDAGSALTSSLYPFSGQDEGQGQHGISDDTNRDEQIDKNAERNAYTSETAYKMENCHIDSPEGCITQGTFTDLCNNKSLWDNVLSMCSGANDNWDGKFETTHAMNESTARETEAGPFPSGVSVCR